MTDADIKLLKENDGKQVEIRCKDGEVIRVTVTFVSESEGDVVCDLISSSRPERYSQRSSEVSYSILFKDIDTVLPSSDV
jgi:hypothetical protein